MGLHSEFCEAISSAFSSAICLAALPLDILTNAGDSTFIDTSYSHSLSTLVFPLTPFLSLVFLSTTCQPLIRQGNPTHLLLPPLSLHESKLIELPDTTSLRTISHRTTVRSAPVSSLIPLTGVHGRTLLIGL